MRLTALHTKKIIPLLFPLLVLAVFVFIMPHVAHAQAPAPPAQTSSWWNFLANSAADIALLLPKMVLYIIQAILVIFLFVASFVLNNVLAYNIILNPTIMPAVKTGWLVLRDIANGLFLIILLWLAIKTIWNIDEAENKKFIIRLIIVAFLINFSLAITGALFGLGSALARPFSEKMGTDVGAFIVRSTKLNTAYQTPSATGTAAAEKIFKENISDCGFSKLVDPVYATYVGCLGGAGAVAVAGELGKIAAYALDLPAVRETIQLGITDVFLFFTIITFGGAIAMLLMRIVMMVFLGILAPAAFFLAAVPGLESYFQKWLKQTIAWSFIAPTFYFLFYISLLILRKMSESTVVQAGSGLNFAANIFAFLPLIVFLTFMWASMSICKKMAGPIAQAAIDMGKRAAGIALAAGAAVATGGTSLALQAGAAVTTAAAGKLAGTGGQAAVERIAAQPRYGRLADPLLRYNKRRADKRDKKIDEKRNAYKDIPVPILTRKLHNAVSRDEKVALGEALHERGPAGATEFDKLDNTTQLEVMSHAEQLNRQDLLKARPDRATKQNVPGARDDGDAQKKVLNKMSSEEKSKISKFALTPDVMKAMLETSSKDDIQAIIRYNAEMMQRLITGFFDENKQWKDGYFVKNQQDLRGTMKQETLNFIDSTMRIQTSRGTNPTPPAQSTPPAPSTTPPDIPTVHAPLVTPPNIPSTTSSRTVPPVPPSTTPPNIPAAPTPLMPPPVIPPKPPTPGP